MLAAALPNIAWNSLFSIIGKLGIKIIAFGFTIFIVRWLGDEGYGQYSLIWSYVIVFSMLSDAGLAMYAIREIATQEPYSQYLIGNIIVIRFILASLTIGLITTVTWLLGYSGQFVGYVFLASTILLLYAVQDPLDAVLQAHERFDLASTAVLAGQVVFVGTGALLLVLGWHITGLIIAGLLNVFLSALLAWYFITRYQCNLQWKIMPVRWPTFMRNSISFGLIKLWLSWSLKVDIVILSWFWLEQVVGWYSAIYALVLGFTVISDAINAALYPTLSRRFATAPETVGKICELSLKYLLVISLPIAAGVSLVADELVQLLYGPDFAQAGRGLAILIWVVPLTFVAEFLRYVLLATNREKIAVRMLGLGVALNIGLNLWLIPRYGMLGASFVAVVTEAFLVILYGYRLRADLKMADWKEAALKPIFATMIMMAALFLILDAPLIQQIGLVSVLYLVLILSLRIVKVEDYRRSLAQTQLREEKTMRLAGSESGEPSSLVSVFILAYNAEKFIEQAIQSVLDQTYKNFELLIIDDGSVDQTAKILDRYSAHPKIAVMHNASNQGISHNWNRALQLCRGELVAKLDADDFYDPHQLETVIDFYEKHPEVGLVFSGLKLVYPDGHIESEVKFFHSWVRTRETFLSTLLRLCIIRAPTVFIKKSCYDQLGGVVQEMILHADWEMWVRVAANCSVGYIAQPLGYYRLSHGPNATAQAAFDGRSIHDLRLWLKLLAENKLPYQLTSEEERAFRIGIYDLEMHFAAQSIVNHQSKMHKAYIAFAEEILPESFSDTEIEKMRFVHTNLHQGICSFRNREFKEARRYFLQAIKSGPKYCKSPWIWNKLLLTFFGRTKWGVLYR